MSLLNYIDEHKDECVGDLKEFLKIPSVSAKQEHKKDMQKAARWIRDRLKSLGFDKVNIIPTEKHPLVYGESIKASGKPVVLFYGHYDVQPAEPLNRWTSLPFEPAIRNGKLYARGVADNKGQIHIHLKALEALIKTKKKLPINIKVLIEGEEEVGSESILKFVPQHKKMLEADLTIVSDTGMYGPKLPTITYGLRGLNYYQIEIEGPKCDLHSGSFGGITPNPLMILADVISKLHDKDFRVTIPGFYDGIEPLSPKERKALKQLPITEETFQKVTGVSHLSGEKGFSLLERLWCRPTLEVNGMWGGYIGEGAKTVIPSKAYAKLSSRLVPGQDPKKIAHATEAYIRKLLPKSVSLHFETLNMTPGWKIDYTHPIFQKADSILTKVFDGNVVYVREGGSIPIISKISETLKTPCLLTGFVLPDCQAHGPDENIDLALYMKGIKAIALLYEALGERQ